MNYYVLYSGERRGPYDSYEKAYMFAIQNIGMLGWEIITTENEVKQE